MFIEKHRRGRKTIWINGIMVAGQFEVHGCSNITVEGNIIVIDAQGPWNYEFMAIIHKNILDAVKHVDINNFAVLLHPIGDRKSVV